MKQETPYAAARRLGHRTYFTGKPCKHGHVAPRITVIATCEICARDIAARSKASNKDGIKRSNAKYYAANSEAVRAMNAQWRDAHSAEMKRLRISHYHQNKSKYASRRAMRRIGVVAAMPSWADVAAIHAVYAEARRLTLESGIPHEVDHIVPLNGANVCGLHIAPNLRAIPALVNRSKGNVHSG